MGQMKKSGYDLEEPLKQAREALPPVWSHPSYRNPHYLTKAELEVFKLVGQGMTNEEIAKALFVTRETARTHIKHIHDKCQVKGRALLALVAHQIFSPGEEASQGGA